MAGLLVLLGGLGSGVGNALAGAGAGAGAGAEAGAGPEAEADVAYHGRVALTGNRLRILLVPENEGPSAVANATVRLGLSADLAGRQELAEGCARAGLREVVCETGELPLHGRGGTSGWRCG